MALKATLLLACIALNGSYKTSLNTLVTPILCYTPEKNSALLLRLLLPIMTKANVVRTTAVVHRGGLLIRSDLDPKIG